MKQKTSSISEIGDVTKLFGEVSKKLGKKLHKNPKNFKYYNSKERDTLYMGEWVEDAFDEEYNLKSSQFGNLTVRLTQDEMLIYINNEDEPWAWYLQEQKSGIDFMWKDCVNGEYFKSENNI